MMEMTRNHGKGVRGFFVWLLLLSLLLQGIAVAEGLEESGNDKGLAGYSVERDGAAGDSDGARVTISKVRLVIDGETFEWSESGVTAAPEAVKPRIKPEVIASFVSAWPGRAGSDREILRWCRESELRILTSGYVYGASVLVVPPRKDPSRRTIVVSVTSGFFMRFGGGKAWGMFGLVGISGERASVKAYAGGNRNGIECMTYRAFGVPLVLGGRVYYNGPGDVDVPKDTVGLTVGWLFNPDLVAGVDAAWRSPDFPVSSDGAAFLAGPFVSWRKYLAKGTDALSGREGDLGFDARLSSFPALGAVSGEGSAFIHLRPTRRTTIACMGATGAARSLESGNGLARDDIPDAAYFDLFYGEDRNVRSGYSEEELRASAFAFGSIEARQTVLSVPLGGAFKLDAQVFAFADFARLEAADGTVDGPTKFVDAYGGGLRLLFDNPVFAYFTFSYGVNRLGDGRFAFSATAGY